MAEAADPAFSMATGYDAGDLCARNTEGVSGSDSDAVATVKTDALTGATSGRGRATSSIATAVMSPMATGDFGWLLHGIVERRG
jgi:hypothetical protein